MYVLHSIMKRWRPALMYAQSTVKCDLCGNDLDENHFCLVCEETMCTACKVIHNKGKATKDHEVVIRAHINSDHTSSRLCSKHPGQMYNLGCEDCEEPVCTICITDTHKGHNLGQPSATVSVLKRKLSNDIDVMENQVIPDIKKSIDMIRKQSDDHDQQVQKVKEDIQAEEDMLKALFTELLDRYKKMKADVNDIEGRNQNVLKSKQKSMTDQLSELQQNLALFKDQITCGDDFEFLKFKSTRPRLDHLKAKPDVTPVVPPSFQPGSLSKQDIVKKLGMIVMSEQSGTDLAKATTQQQKSATPTLLSSFSVQDKYFPYISTTHDGRAWISRCESCVLEPYDSNGNTKQSIKVSQPRKVAALPNKEALIVSYGARKVYKAKENGELQTVIKCSPWFPKGICVQRNNRFLLCEYKDDAGRIIQCTDQGEIQQVIQPEGKGGNRLLRNPLFITETSSGNICVSDYDLHKMFFLDKQGVLLNTYEGPTSKRDEEFNPRGVCTDKCGHVLVADMDNHCIDLLSENGEFIQQLLTRENGLNQPYDLSVDDNYNLWVTMSDGVKVFKIIE